MSHVYLLTIVFAIYIIDGIATATSSPSQLTQVSHREVPIAMQCTQHLARHPSKQAFLLRLLCSFWVSIWSTVVEPQVCGTRPVKSRILAGVRRGRLRIPILIFLGSA